MSGETPITMTGNVVADPELRFTPSGAAVCNFRMAATPRKFNRQTNAWEDGEPLFLGVAVWRQQAEHVASSVLRGMRVIVVGHLTQRQYEDREGKTRSSYEIQADEVAPSLLRATAVVTKANGSTQSTPQAYGQQPAGDQWATGGYSNEPTY